MCRFLCYSGDNAIMHDLVFAAENSLIEQSKKAKERSEPVNGDGFGIGWYPDFDDIYPGTFVSIEPAWSNRNLTFVTTKIKSPTFFAHVRDATGGTAVSQSNCHPFHCGRFLWMHNGHIAEFEKIKRGLTESLSDRAFHFIKGNTDTEHAFALFLDHIDFNELATFDEIEQALIDTLTTITELQRKYGVTENSLLNFAVSNGSLVLVTRYSTIEDEQPASLYYTASKVERNNNDIICRPPKHDEIPSYIIASEPLTAESEHWYSVAKQQLLRIEEGELTLRKIVLA